MYRMGAIGLVVATCLAGGAARADQWTVPSVPWLLGDWGGLRTRFYQQGIDFQFGYANEFATNTQGGVKRWAGYADQSTAGATLNLERLFGVTPAATSSPMRSSIRCSSFRRCMGAARPPVSPNSGTTNTIWTISSA